MNTVAIALAAFFAVLAAGFAGWRLGRRRRSAPPAIEAVASSSFTEAIAEERDRIYKDLHDDVGAKLLQLVHGAETPQQADLARAVIQDLRDVVSRSRRPPAPLLQLLGEIEAESRQRLAAAGAELVWEQEPGLPDQPLGQAQTLHLIRIGREAISNALRHGGAHWLRVRVCRVAEELVLEITDDGSFAPTRIGEGRGTATMRERATGLGGDIQWDQGTLGGTKVILRARVFGAGGAVGTPPIR